MRERAKKEKCAFSNAIFASMPFTFRCRALLPTAFRGESKIRRMAMLSALPSLPRFFAQSRKTPPFALILRKRRRFCILKRAARPSERCAQKTPSPAMMQRTAIFISCDGENYTPRRSLRSFSLSAWLVVRTWPLSGTIFASIASSIQLGCGKKASSSS